MALDKAHTWDWSGLRLQVKELVIDGQEATSGVDASAAAQADADSALAALDAVSGLTVLTDNTSASANNTVENVPQASAAVTDTTAASLTSVNTALTAIENDIADLAAKINEIIAAAAP